MPSESRETEPRGPRGLPSLAKWAARFCCAALLAAFIAASGPAVWLVVWYYRIYLPPHTIDGMPMTTFEKWDEFWAGASFTGIFSGVAGLMAFYAVLRGGFQKPLGRRAKNHHASSPRP